MRTVVYEDQSAMIRWAADRIGIETFRPDARAIGMRRGESFAGVVVFDNFSPGSCFISVASDGSGRWLTREFLIRTFAYPFLQIGQRRLTAIVSERNIASIRFCESCGFLREGVLRRDGPNGEDTLVFGMLRAECRFLPAGKTAGEPL